MAVTIRITTGNGAHASTTGNGAHASTTGLDAHASTTGRDAHASTTGRRAHASTTGNGAYASTTGDYAHASTSGLDAHASTAGSDAYASTTGNGARASASGRAGSAACFGLGGLARCGPEGSVTLAYENRDGRRQLTVGDAGVDIEPGVFYEANSDGELVARRDVLGWDRRGFVLSFEDGQYRAGCRVFTYEEAVAHWGDPNHHDPAAAAQLLGMVEAHQASLV